MRIFCSSGEMKLERIVPSLPVTIIHTLKKELAMPNKKGFFLSTYRVNQKPQKLDTLKGKISTTVSLPKEWLEDDWSGIEFIVDVPGAETDAADIESQVKDGLKRRQQELIRHLLGRGEHERTASDIALIEQIAKEGKISISLHDLVNWQSWRGIGRKPATPEDAAKKAIAGFKKKGMDNAQILALFTESLPEE